MVARGSAGLRDATRKEDVAGGPASEKRRSHHVRWEDAGMLQDTTRVGISGRLSLTDLFRSMCIRRRTEPETVA